MMYFLQVFQVLKKIKITGNLAHWKEIHPDQEVIYKCLEIERTTQQLCNFTSKESEEIFKHRSKHKIIRENSQTAVDVKPDVTIE